MWIIFVCNVIFVIDALVPLLVWRLASPCLLALLLARRRRSAEAEVACALALVLALEYRV